MFYLWETSQKEVSFFKRPSNFSTYKNRFSSKSMMRRSSSYEWNFLFFVVAVNNKQTRTSIRHSCASNYWFFCCWDGAKQQCIEPPLRPEIVELIKASINMLTVSLFRITKTKQRNFEGKRNCQNSLKIWIYFFFFFSPLSMRLWRAASIPLDGGRSWNKATKEGRDCEEKTE